MKMLFLFMGLSLLIVGNTGLTGEVDASEIVRCDFYCEFDLSDEDALDDISDLDKLCKPKTNFPFDFFDYNINLKLLEFVDTSPSYGAVFLSVVTRFIPGVEFDANEFAASRPSRQVMRVESSHEEDNVELSDGVYNIEALFLGRDDYLKVGRVKYSNFGTFKLMTNIETGNRIAEGLFINWRIIGNNLDDDYDMNKGAIHPYFNNCRNI